MVSGRYGQLLIDLCRIRALPGNDQLFGHGGVDHITGGGNDDIIYGGQDDDILSGDSGEPGRDTIYGEAGNDIIGGGGNADVVFGGTGNDKIWGDSSYDVIDVRTDAPAGTASKDQLYGEDGDDSGGWASSCRTRC